MTPLRLETTNGAYATSAAHLRDELARVDLLVRAQVVRWRRTIGAAKPEQLWGMVHVSDAEIDQYLGTEPGPPGRIPETLANELKPHWDRELAAAADIRLAVAASTIPLRVEQLRTRFELTDAELDVVLLALLPELDLRYRRIFGYLQDDASRSAPPVDLVAQLVHHKVPTLEEKTALFEPSGRLLRWNLIHIDDRAVRIDPRIASFLTGHDPRERIVATDVEFDDTTRVLEPFAKHGDARAIVILQGPPGSGRLRAARAVCRERGLALLRYDAAREAVDALAMREARLQHAALFVANADKLEAPPVDADVLTFLATETALDCDSRCLRFEFGVPHFDERRAIWTRLLPDFTQHADKLAAAFQLTEGQIREAIDAATMLARRRSIEAPRLTLEDLFEGSRRVTGRRLAGFARRLEPAPNLTVDSVILPRASKMQLRELRDRVKLQTRLAELTAGRAIGRGEGLLVLFAGPSGTGKTLAAEAIASEHGVDLYKVDASAVVSKWVGETEKNLSRVFGDAEGSGALLFFDECDALFGQRGEISDGQDRWANMQVNYLLQRVEDYPGVIILATNLRGNLDEAFLRRIQIILEFPVPDATLRRELWRRSLEGWPGVGDEELHDVAERFSLTGGSIRNVAVESMFRALAKNRDTLSLRDLIASVAREYQKLARPVTKGEFGEQYYGWAVADVIAP